MVSFPAPIAVLGAGAVGMLLAGHLWRVAPAVHLLGRAPIAGRAARHGLRVETIDDTFDVPAGMLHAHETEDSLRATLRGRCALVLVTARTFSTAALAPLAMELCAENGCILPVQNGVDSWETLRAAGARRILGGVISTGVHLPAPGIVRVSVFGRPLMIGVPPFVDTPLRDELAELVRERIVPAFVSSGIPAMQPTDIRAEQWQKALYNCTLSVGAALHGGTCRDYAELPGAHDEMRAVIREIYAVAAAHDIAMLPPTAREFEDDVFFGGSHWLGRTLDHRPSMQEPLLAGRETEIESFCGAIERMGRAAGVPTPVNARLAAAVRARRK